MNLYSTCGCARAFTRTHTHTWNAFRPSEMLLKCDYSNETTRDYLHLCDFMSYCTVKRAFAWNALQQRLNRDFWGKNWFDSDFHICDGHAFYIATIYFSMPHFFWSHARLLYLSLHNIITLQLYNVYFLMIQLVNEMIKLKSHKYKAGVQRVAHICVCVHKWRCQSLVSGQNSNSS